MHIRLLCLPTYMPIYGPLPSVMYAYTVPLPSFMYVSKACLSYTVQLTLHNCLYSLGDRNVGGWVSRNNAAVSTMQWLTRSYRSKCVPPPAVTLTIVTHSSDSASTNHLPCLIDRFVIVKFLIDIIRNLIKSNHRSLFLMPIDSQVAIHLPTSQPSLPVTSLGCYSLVSAPAYRFGL